MATREASFASVAEAAAEAAASAAVCDAVAASAAETDADSWVVDPMLLRRRLLLVAGDVDEGRDQLDWCRSTDLSFLDDLGSGAKGGACRIPVDRMLFRFLNKGKFIHPAGFHSLLTKICGDHAALLRIQFVETWLEVVSSMSKESSLSLLEKTL